MRDKETQIEQLITFETYSERSGFGSLDLKAGKNMADAIFYDEVVPYVSRNLVADLKDGGKLIAPVAAENGTGHMKLIEKVVGGQDYNYDLTQTTVGPKAYYQEPREPIANVQK